MPSLEQTVAVKLNVFFKSLSFVFISWKTKSWKTHIIYARQFQDLESQVLKSADMKLQKHVRNVATKFWQSVSLLFMSSKTKS